MTMADKEEKTRAAKEASDKVSLSPDEQAAPEEVQPEGKTIVKNAHAAGLGAIGRNDQKQGTAGEDSSHY